MVASSTSPSNCPHFTDMPFLVLLENDRQKLVSPDVVLQDWHEFFTISDTYTSPSGVYFEPEMSNWPRETLSPSTFSMTNICMETWQKTVSALDLLCFSVISSLCRSKMKWKWTHLSYTHLVGGERTSLVRADDWGAAKGLHRGQASDDGVLLCHTTCSQSQAGGDDSGQAWWTQRRWQQVKSIFTTITEGKVKQVGRWMKC